ncbi:hypothetical protein BDZ91DRAFT_794913 [Kalaharituber pfeilii]|nr:hypothetical protein BDZ91DRAFT_794913 [Kalaharituber pfeilii]
MFSSLVVSFYFLSWLPTFAGAITRFEGKNSEVGFGPGFSACSDNCQVQLAAHCSENYDAAKVQDCWCSPSQEAAYFSRLQRCLDACPGGKRRNISQRELLLRFRDIVCAGGEKNEVTDTEFAEFYLWRLGPGNAWVPKPTDAIPPPVNVQKKNTGVDSAKPNGMVHLRTITMIATSPTKRSQIPSIVPPGTTTVGTPKATQTHTSESKAPEKSANLSTAQFAGILAGGIVFLITLAVFAYFLFRRSKARKATRRNSIQKTKNLEFLTLNLEASSSPWNYSPVNTVNARTFPSTGVKQEQPPQLPPVNSVARGSVLGVGGALSKIAGVPTVSAPKLFTVFEPEPPKPAVQKGKSSIGTAVRKMSSTFSSRRNSTLPQAGEHKDDHNEINGTFRTRNTSSPWAWGNSLNGQDPVTPVNYLGYGGRGMDLDHDPLDPVSNEIEVDKLMGVAPTDHASAQLASQTNGLPPNPNPPPTSALPAPPAPVADGYPPKVRRRPLPQMTIPVPSATAAATANLATFTLLHQSLCRSSVCTNEADASPTCTSPASTTRYTYCEGMSPTSPMSHHCATNHSSCVWSCFSMGETPRSSRHTQSLYSVPSTPYRSSRGPNSCTHSSSGYFPSSPSVAPPLPTKSPKRPGPLNLSSKAKKKLLRQQDLLAGEMAELPPSPRRLPEEIERVTREMKERQQEEVLRRLYGDVSGGSGNGEGSSSTRGRSGSVATVTSRKGMAHGIYGVSWPERI